MAFIRRKERELVGPREALARWLRTLTEKRSAILTLCSEAPRCWADLRAER
jgi:hypothetical protein